MFRFPFILIHPHKHLPFHKTFKKNYLYNIDTDFEEMIEKIRKKLQISDIRLCYQKQSIQSSVDNQF